MAKKISAAGLYACPLCPFLKPQELRGMRVPGFPKKVDEGLWRIEYSCGTVIAMASKFQRQTIEIIKRGIECSK